MILGIQTMLTIQYFYHNFISYLSCKWMLTNVCLGIVSKKGCRFNQLKVSIKLKNSLQKRESDDFNILPVLSIIFDKTG